MSDTSILKLFTSPLTPSFAALLILAGIYSLLVNVKHDAKHNCMRSAKFARFAGWCYIIGGAGILIIL